MIGSSAALTLSGLPFIGPIGAARIGYINGDYILNPTSDEQLESNLDLVVAGTSDHVLMVESEARELSEEVMLGAVLFGLESWGPVIDLIVDLAEAAAKEPWALPEEVDHTHLRTRISDIAESKLREAYEEQVKQVRVEKVEAVKLNVMSELESEEEDTSSISGGFKALEKDIVRKAIIDTGTRIDGRTTTDIRPIACEVGILPRAHGSALFTRGETQALVATTLGTGQDEQVIDALEGEYREAFMLHYNFPPYSVGETSFRLGPGRREIGHGKLAWRAIKPLMPSNEDFPYTVRVVSEITESNGSSSMATVCGTSLSLMDAGVPVSKPVAGIAMGLILDGDKYAVLSDILGDEDHLGDMDFKVAGTRDGVTSLQMDIKVTGITSEIMKVALAQAKDGRRHILEQMTNAISEARSEVGEHAPRITTMMVPKEKIREVIGTGGSVIRDICEVSGAKVDIDDDGTIKVAATSTASADKALEMIRNIVAEPEVGVIYRGKVVKTVDFGAFVNFIGSRDGLVHISELENRRVGRVTDVVQDGDEVFVKVLGIDDRGKVRLSMRVVDQESGEEVVEEKESDDS